MGYLLTCLILLLEGQETQIVEHFLLELDHIELIICFSSEGKVCQGSSGSWSQQRRQELPRTNTLSGTRTCWLGYFLISEQNYHFLNKLAHGILLYFVGLALGKNYEHKINLRLFVVLSYRVLN